MAARRLHLLRHAKSSWDDPALADHERPLAPRGVRAAKAMGDHLRGAGIAPEVVLCSDSARTRQTLELLGEGVGGADVRILHELYEASPRTILELARGTADGISSLMVIGHNPGMHELAVDLAGRGERVADLRAKFPTGALATLELDGPWADLAPESADLVALVKPRELE